MFKMTLDDLQELLRIAPKKKGIDRASEILFVGLISYFEGFLKEVFASAINIDNTLLNNLGENGQDVSIDSRRLMVYGENVYKKLGFVVSEKFDFGTAKKINSLYLALLKVSPFSKDAVKLFDKLLTDRNLVVHHGSNYTLSYLEQTKAASIENAYWNCLIVDQAYFCNAFKFIEETSNNLVNSVSTALHSRFTVEDLHPTPVQIEATDALAEWGP
jgi:hypothetical protein